MSQSGDEQPSPDWREQLEQDLGAILHVDAASFRRPAIRARPRTFQGNISKGAALAGPAGLAFALLLLIANPLPRRVPVAPGVPVARVDRPLIRHMRQSPPPKPLEEEPRIALLAQSPPLPTVPRSVAHGAEFAAVRKGGGSARRHGSSVLDKPALQTEPDTGLMLASSPKLVPGTPMVAGAQPPTRSLALAADVPASAPPPAAPGPAASALPMLALNFAAASPSRREEGAAASIAATTTPDSTPTKVLRRERAKLESIDAIRALRRQ